jgi:hypothetical protein
VRPYLINKVAGDVAQKIDHLQEAPGSIPSTAENLQAFEMKTILYIIMLSELSQTEKD